MTIGVVVMAYGTPASPDDVEGYYTHIRRGRPPSEEQLADLISRYEAIGGISPLSQHTESQRAAIQAALDERAPGAFSTTIGNKHAAPFIEDAVAGLAAQPEIERIVGVVLAPHYSGASVGEYHRRAEAALAEHDSTGNTIDYVAIDRWFDLPGFVAHQAESLRSVVAELEPPIRVVFTAHSLPERVLDGDPYPDELGDSAARIAAAAGVDDYEVAWQSAGATPEPWRGPDILEVIAEPKSTGETVVVVPQGFTSEHLEVLFDLDRQATEAAAEVGGSLTRTDVVGNDETVMGDLAGRIVEAAEAADRL